MAPSVQEIRKAREGRATVLAIGTANPPNCVYNADFADYYFRVTNSEHMTNLKEKIKHLCDTMKVEKRYMYVTEEILKENPNMVASTGSSLDSHQDLMVAEVPRLAKEAANKAIDEWGQPKSNITHMVMFPMTAVDMPGADYQLTKLLGLSPSVRRFMIYQQGCFAGGSALRMAKDIAEDNKGARVLVVCSEILTALTFAAPSEKNFVSKPNQTLFGDGAVALIVGADPELSIEKPIFEIIWTAQTILPGSEDAITGHLREDGISAHISKEVPSLISKNIEKILIEAFSPLGITDWNSLFMIMHPGWFAILDQIEAELGLKAEKLKATRQVLNDYGNMASATVLFIMDRMRKNSVKNRGPFIMSIEDLKLALRSTVEMNKLNGKNLIDWERNLRIVLRFEGYEYVLSTPIPSITPTSTDEEKEEIEYLKADSVHVTSLMLAGMKPDFQKKFEHQDAYTIIKELRKMQDRIDQYETHKAIIDSTLVKGKPVGPHVLDMIGLFSRMESLGAPYDPVLAADIVLRSLHAGFASFRMRFHIDGLKPSLNELHGMLVDAEKNMDLDKRKKVLDVNTGNGIVPSTWKK